MGLQESNTPEVTERACMHISLCHHQGSSLCEKPVPDQGKNLSLLPSPPPFPVLNISLEGVQGAELDEPSQNMVVYIDTDELFSQKD